QTHRSLERAVVGVEVVALVADHHELAGLVGGDQQRRAQLPQQRGEIRGVGGPQRPGIFHLGGSRGRRRAGGCTLLSHVFPNLRSLGPEHGGQASSSAALLAAGIEKARGPRPIRETGYINWEIGYNRQTS